jgi:hypothetical protein
VSPIPPPEALILVAVLNDPRDMEIVRLLGWYRIPFRTAPKVVAVDYIAFYQTSSFGEERWRIQKIAPVLGHELTTRGALLKEEVDHPRANDEYYKIQLGPVVQLEKPILAKHWRRITFFYTTGEYLLTADTINDLVVQSEDRKVLWKALRDRASQDQIYYPDQLDSVDVDPTVLAALLGISELEEGYEAEKPEEPMEPLTPSGGISG